MASRIALNRPASSAAGRGRLSTTCACAARPDGPSSVSRRETLRNTAALLVVTSQGGAALASKAPPAPTGPIPTELCDAATLASLPEPTRLPSGLAYNDIKVGTGPSPVKGFQVVVNYIAMSSEYKVFDNSLEKQPYDIRFGTGAVIPGLDEGLKTMKAGGIRRLYIPGNMAFPKGLGAAAGRARVQPASPVVFDVQLLLVPGFDIDE